MSLYHDVEVVGAATLPLQAELHAAALAAADELTGFGLLAPGAARFRTGGANLFDWSESALQGALPSTRFGASFEAGCGAAATLGSAATGGLPPGPFRPAME